MAAREGRVGVTAVLRSEQPSAAVTRLAVCRVAVIRAAVGLLLVVTMAVVTGCAFGGPPDRSSGTFGDQQRQPFAARDGEGAPEVGAPEKLASEKNAGAAASRAAEAVTANRHDRHEKDTAPAETGTARGRARRIPVESEASGPMAGAAPAAARAAGRTAAQPVAKPGAAKPATTRQATRQQERLLRNRFATANPVAPAALELAAFLVVAERHQEALHAIDQALQRERTPALRIARAGLLRDLARPADAARELSDLRRERGVINLAPGTLLELAEVQWVAGRNDEAAATVAELRRAYADDPWLVGHAKQLEAAEVRIRKAGAPGEDPLANGELRDVLALLRAAPRATARQRLLARLTATDPTGPSRDGEPDARQPIRLQAIAIAAGDSAAGVRAFAIRAAARCGVVDPDFWRTALLDPAALVRRFAAPAAVRPLGNDAPKQLFEALRREQDPEAFRALHRALAEALAPQLSQSVSSDFDPNDPQARADAVSAWEQRWPQ